MRIDIFDQTIELSANRSIVLHDPRGAQIVCIAGRIWVTEDPLRNDIVLHAGQSHTVSTDGMTFVTSFADSRVRLIEPLRVDRPAPAAGFRALLNALSQRASTRWLQAAVR
ncbi:MAG TPA: DUF2917 domain-containing protein [Burkholderiaceae bacterium]|nr:DUF2917 domain-containing protein [Burkholderiaceae bacterium]